MSDPETADEAIGGRVRITIDGIESMVPPGTTILEAAQGCGIKIPTLCHHADVHPAGVCRMCLVEVEGQRAFQTACTFSVFQPVRVRTHTPRIRRARKHVLELLLSEHSGDCCSCSKNNNCELQALAAEFGIERRRFGQTMDVQCGKIDSGGYIIRDMNKCVLCRRCVRVCADLQTIGVLGPHGRGDETVIGTFRAGALIETSCIHCGQCVNRCPTGALRVRDDTERVWEAISDPRKHVVIQTAPAPRAAIGEEFGLPAGAALTFELNTALKLCGFDKVFDTNFSADLTIIEEATELLLRLYDALEGGKGGMPLPQFSSCSPGWIKYVERFYPEYLAHVSSAKSPQQMFGALMKTHYARLERVDPADMVTVSLMPCSAKKFECDRPEMRTGAFKDVDISLTTRELARMLKEAGIWLPGLRRSDFDAPFGTATGSGVVFGATGGVTESALRTIFELVIGSPADPDALAGKVSVIRGFDGIKYLEFSLPEEIGRLPALLTRNLDLPFSDWNWIRGAALKFAVYHGIGNAKKVMDDIKGGGRFSKCHFIEFMACPGGCLGGGGQPIPADNTVRARRAAAIYAEDKSYAVRKAHENPAILEIYEKIFKEGPGSEPAHALLHTHYTPRCSSNKP